MSQRNFQSNGGMSFGTNITGQESSEILDGNTSHAVHNSSGRNMMTQPRIVSGIGLSPGMQVVNMGTAQVNTSLPQWQQMPHIMSTNVSSYFMMNEHKLVQKVFKENLKIYMNNSFQIIFE